MASTSVSIKDTCPLSFYDIVACHVDRAYKHVHVYAGPSHRLACLSCLCPICCVCDPINDDGVDWVVLVNTNQSFHDLVNAGFWRL